MGTGDVTDGGGVSRSSGCGGEGGTKEEELEEGMKEGGGMKGERETEAWWQ